MRSFTVVEVTRFQCNKLSVYFFLGGETQSIFFSNGMVKSIYHNKNSNRLFPRYQPFVRVTQGIVRSLGFTYRMVEK